VPAVPRLRSSSKHSQVHPNTPVGSEMVVVGPAPMVVGSAPGHSGALDIEAPNINSVVQQEAQHSMTPPQAEVGVPLCLLPAPSLSGRFDDEHNEDALYEAVAIIPGSSDALVAVQRRTLNGLSVTLDAAVKLSAYYYTLNNAASVCMSTMELILNALIMMSSSMPAFQRTGISDDIVAICAAVNAVLKGLQMKLQFDVKAADVSMAFSKFKSLQEKVNHVKLNVDSRNAPLPDTEFADLMDDFRELVSAHASWIPSV